MLLLLLMLLVLPSFVVVIVVVGKYGRCCQRGVAWRGWQQPGVAHNIWPASNNGVFAPPGVAEGTSEGIIATQSHWALNTEGGIVWQSRWGALLLPTSLPPSLPASTPTSLTHSLLPSHPHSIPGPHPPHKHYSHHSTLFCFFFIFSSLYPHDLLLL